MKTTLTIALFGAALAGGLASFVAGQATTAPATATDKDNKPDWMATIEDMKQKAAVLRDDINHQTGLVEISLPSVRQLVQRLQEQREELELEAAGAKGRKDGLEDAIAKWSKQIVARANDDAEAEQRKNIVALREAQLARIKSLANSGAITKETEEDAESALASAKADLAIARRRATGTTATDALDTWNRQLLELTVAAHERDARIEHIELRLRAFSRKVMDEVTELDQLQAELRPRAGAGPAAP